MLLQAARAELRRLKRCESENQSQTPITANSTSPLIFQNKATDKKQSNNVSVQNENYLAQDKHSRNAVRKVFFNNFYQY